MKQKSILAFSGGLDTSVVVKYMQDMHDMDVITVTVDVGQGDDSTKIAKKAKKLGVKKHYNIDAKKEFGTRLQIMGSELLKILGHQKIGFCTFLAMKNTLNIRYFRERA